MWAAVADETASAVRYGFKGKEYILHFNDVNFNLCLKEKS